MTEVEGGMTDCIYMIAEATFYFVLLCSCSLFPVLYTFTSVILICSVA